MISVPFHGYCPTSQALEDLAKVEVEHLQVIEYKRHVQEVTESLSLAQSENQKVRSTASVSTIFISRKLCRLKHVFLISV